jgi:predicted Zn finger-like uncharacterized protein
VAIPASICYTESAYGEHRDARCGANPTAAGTRRRFGLTTAALPEGCHQEPMGPLLMANIVKCPECQKALKLSDAAAGKRVRCPACQHSFAAPAAEDEAAYAVEPTEEGVAERPVRRSPRDSEEDDRPRAPRRRRPSRSREFTGEQVAVSSAPLVYGILAFVFSCIPIAAFIFGGLALTKASEESARIPGGKRYNGARTMLLIARILAAVGICLGVVFCILGVVFKVMDRTAR